MNETEITCECGMAMNLPNISIVSQRSRPYAVTQITWTCPECGNVVAYSEEFNLNPDEHEKQAKPVLT